MFPIPRTESFGPPRGGPVSGILPWITGVCAALLVAAVPARGQSIPTLTLPELGGALDEAIRTEQLLGERSSRGYLARSPSELLRLTVEERRADEAEGIAEGIAVVTPTVTTVWNSDLPWSMNDGALWAGRGLNLVARAGARGRWGPVTVLLAPEVVHQQNQSFQVLHAPGTDGAEPSFWAHPFHPRPQSLDAPIRFGAHPRTRVVPGQSSVTVSARGAAFGVATENLWWGPGLRNAIVLSDHAEGVPHLFLRTDGPVETGAGALEARWMVGRLAESPWFDENPDNDRRTLSGLVITFSPAPVPDLTVGFARIVVAPLEPGATGLGAAFDVFGNVGRPNADPGEPPTDEDDGASDQIFSFFGRWVLPASGLEVWGEWARFEQPASLRDFLELPQHSQGYTVGLQWARRLRTPARFQLQVEATFLEPSSTFDLKRVYSSYTSRAVPQGFTQRGQVLGAAIGSGASSQWLALDYLRPRWRAGVYGRRVRWDNAALFTDVVPGPKREDVTLGWGVRGGVEIGPVRVDADLGTSVRYNYLFQTFQPDPRTGSADGVDVVSHSLRLTVSEVPGG